VEVEDARVMRVLCSYDAQYKEILRKSTELDELMEKLQRHTCEIRDLKEYYKRKNFERQTKMLEAVLPIGAYPYSCLMFRRSSSTDQFLSRSPLPLLALERGHS
jgi:hypothetical protein